MSNYPLETIRHSAAHVMAAAVQKLYPDAKFDIGPATEGGFYYDFDMHSKAGGRHLKSSKNAKRRRRLRQDGAVKSTEMKRIKAALPYGL